MLYYLTTNKYNKNMLLISLIILSILFIIMLILLSKKIPQIKGKIGENVISQKLTQLPIEKYIVFNDLLINTSYGTTQIDHVVLSEYGIFVIETKNYTGWILGGENSEEWTKNVYGNKYSFHNPLKQNYAHIKALMEKLCISSKSLFIPIVVFSNNAEIKIKTTKNVINENELINTIYRYQEEKVNNIQIKQYSKILSNFTEYTKENKKEHILMIKNNINKKKDDINNSICPKCGNKLIKRNGKYGNFIGCSNYPNCLFTCKM